MSIVQYDEKFDIKVEAGARALLRDRAARGLLSGTLGNLDDTRQEARLVLLAAMAVEADADYENAVNMTAQWLNEKLTASEMNPISITSESLRVRHMPSTVRQVAYKILQLPERDQVEVIRSLDLEEPGDDDLLDYQSALAAVKRASERGYLADLDEALDRWKDARG